MKSLLAVLLTVVLLMSASQAGTITVKGSDTMVRLGQRWAEEYMKAHPGSVIQVSGGGSGTGIAALLNGTTQICQASRDMSEKEYKQAKDKGITLFRVAMALDGIAVFVNEKNPVGELTLAQLKSIYTGVVTNWKQVGGPDRRIILYGRENNSGTYVFFKEHVLANQDYAPETQTLPGTAAVVNAVSKDQFGIGYGGLAWAKGVKDVAVKKDDSTQSVLPRIETVTSGTYPISRQLYWFLNGRPEGDLKSFLNWALSSDGQKLAEATDYIPLPSQLAEQNTIK